MYKQSNKFNNSISKNLYQKEWEKIEKKSDKPYNYKKVISIEHKEFISKILEQDPSFVKRTVESIYNGDLYLLKNSLSKEKIDHVINTIHEYNQSYPSTFHKMHEGIPNFHRWIGKGRAENSYCIKHIKHATYLFPWNEDIKGVRKIIMDACRPLKLLAGLSLNEFTNNTPKDNQIERVQVTRYPPSGYIEPHMDPVPNIRFIISGYLSKRGVDYSEGGFYLVDEKNGKLDMEQYIDKGDVGFFMASLRHGLATIDSKKPADIKKKDGRWWFGLNMHNSDVIKPEERHVGTPYDINSNVY